MKIIKKYVPNKLSNDNKIKQKKFILKSRKLYKNKIYYNRPKLKSFKSRISPHILKAKKMYKLKTIIPNKKLAKATKCKITGLKQIVKKGQGAYYSSGSRPNQSAHSWGIARLGSAITGGKSAKIDYHILKKYCKKNSIALKLASSNKLKKTGGGKIIKPYKNKKGDIIFSDVSGLYPEFKPNLSPEEIFRLGSFGGTYFRPIYSNIKSKKLKNNHKEFIKLGWFKNLNIDDYVINSKCNPTLNKYKVNAGTSLKLWEDSGWIKPVDPYGWFQWYCRFYAGRRCSDDERQIKRWINYAGENKGRWRRRLINMCKKKNKKYDDISVSPVIRQGLQHWAYILT